jgi:hypothetical protein
MDHFADWQVTSPAGMSQLLKRLKIGYKRSRDYLHSPDPNYEAKTAWNAQCLEKASQDPERWPFFYLDEVTYYRQPTPARAYEAQGHDQPLAPRSYRSNTVFRVLAALNAFSGQVTYRQRSKTNIPCLTGFWYDLRAAYPEAERLYIVLDNWPVHFHPDVLAPLIDQHFPFPVSLSHTWSGLPTKRARFDDLPIQLLQLPTYASWLNPIEKLWRWLKQDRIHMHRMADDWGQLQALVAHFLDQFQDPSPALLRYVGLLPM